MKERFGDYSGFNEPGEENPNIITNPQEFVSSWHQSDQYQKAYEKFFAGKNLAPDVTEEEKQQVFEGADSASQSLILFARNSKRKFSYSSSEYSPQTKKAVDDYVEAAKYLIKQLNHGGRDEMMAADKHRALFHNELAKRLIKEKIVSTQKVGRAFGRLILIDLGLDSFSSASKTDEERARILAYQNFGN